MAAIIGVGREFVETVTALGGLFTVIGSVDQVASMRELGIIGRKHIIDAAKFFGRKIEAKIPDYMGRTGSTVWGQIEKYGHIPTFEYNPQIENAMYTLSTGDYAGVWQMTKDAYRDTQWVLRKITGIKYAPKGTPKWLARLEGLKIRKIAKYTKMMQQKPLRTSHLMEAIHVQNLSKWNKNIFAESNARRMHINFRTAVRKKPWMIKRNKAF